MSNKCSKKTGSEPAPLTAFQTALWASHRLDPENTGHNSPLLVQWNCDIDIVRFEHAFAEVVRTTDSLRAVFEQTEGEVFQTALDHVGSQMPWRDFSDHPNARLAAISWIAEIAAKPHDLVTTPFRTALALSLIHI